MKKFLCILIMIVILLFPSNIYAKGVYKLKKLMSLIKKDNCGSKEIKDANFFLECHKILMERVYPENETDVDSIPLIYLN